MARTRAELEAFIKSGASVTLPDGRVATKIEDLPGEGDLAKGDRVRLQAEHDRLNELVEHHTKERDAVKKQLDAADKDTAEKVAEAPKESPEKATEKAPDKQHHTGEKPPDRHHHAADADKHKK